NQALHETLDHIAKIHYQAITGQSIFPLFVNRLPLNIHDVIILQQSLPYSKVVFLHLFLSSFYRPGHHPVLDHFPFFESHTVHDLDGSLVHKQSHQVVLQRNKKLRASRIPLTTSPATQLSVHPTGVVPFCSDDRQTSGCLHFLTDLDIRTPTSHIGS